MEPVYGEIKCGRIIWKLRRGSNHGARVEKSNVGGSSGSGDATVYAEIKCGRIMWKLLGNILGTHRRMSIEGCPKGSGVSGAQKWHVWRIAYTWNRSLFVIIFLNIKNTVETNRPGIKIWICAQNVSVCNLFFFYVRIRFSGPDRDGHKKPSWRVFLERNSLLEEVPGKK